jgi:hypothetical protein
MAAGAGVDDRRWTWPPTPAAFINNHDRLSKLRARAQGQHPPAPRRAPMAQRYWIVGGEYRDTAFTELKPESRTINGPFASYTDALSRWRAMAEASRHDAYTRFTIAVEAGRQAAG